MKVSINRANKLRNSLEALSFAGSYFVTVRTNVSAEEANTIFRSGEDAALSMVNNLAKKYQYTQTIRDLIFLANINHEIVPIISAIAALEGQIKAFSAMRQNMLERASRTGSVETFIDRVNYISKMEDKEGKVLPPESVMIDTTGPSRTLLDEELRRLKLLLSEKQEERNRKNHENYVELPDDLVEFLKLHGLIA